MAHIGEHDRQIFNSILHTEERLNELWEAMRKGEATLERFRQALTIREDLHLKAIELYKGELK